MWAVPLLPEGKRRPEGATGEDGAATECEGEYIKN